MFSKLLSSIANTILQTSAVEWIIFVLALIYLMLATVENVWCWLFGILASAFSVYLCFEGNLFLESGLQVFYVIIGIYGWYEWLHGSSQKKELKIISWPFLKNSYLILAGCILWIPFGTVAQRYSTQAMPYLDGFITAFSIVATWMTAKKILQNWIFWIIIDALAIVLYASREFYLIALLYAIYTLLAVTGYFQWKKRIQVPSVLP